MKPVLVWFRNDLRLSDNPALHWAVQSGKPIVAIYILEDDNSPSRPPGGASRWWLHHSLKGLAKTLNSRGINLIIRRGAAKGELRGLIAQTGADAVVWNRRYDATDIIIDKDIKAGLSETGVEARSFNGTLLVEPWEMQTKSGTPFRVFTPFWKALLSGSEPRTPYPVPQLLPAVDAQAASSDVNEFGLLPKLDWSDGFHDHWSPGEDGAQILLESFLRTSLADYRNGRDFPARSVTSRLSAHLRFGEISPVQIWHAVKMGEARGDLSSQSADKFLSEIAWREFAYHLLYYNPELATKNYNPAFDGFAWRFEANMFDAWKKGATGYPIVDAGMRQLWRTGWMHNRVRMITASFLIKHLLVDWRHGEAWFWDTLVDADPANNPAGWQWVAGSGADASPYFRIFNPVLQGEKFDCDGEYVRRWVPELTGLGNKWLHKPWQAPVDVLRHSGIVLGQTYPKPIVDHAAARELALAGYKALRTPGKPDIDPEASSTRMAVPVHGSDTGLNHRQRGAEYR